MRDDVVRNREIEAIRRLLDHVTQSHPAARAVVDIGCGNGYLLESLHETHASLDLSGLEYTPEMVEIAKARGIAGVTITQGDVRSLPFPRESFDVAITERCIINIMDRDDQARSILEVARVLRPGGHFICIEAFTDGLGELNAARAEMGLAPNEQPHHNLWFDKQWFLDTISTDYTVVDLAGEGDQTLPSPNFLSSHYFISRVLYPCVTQREVLYNTHFVKFFRFLPPMGNYAPVQVYLLRKRG